MKKNRSEIVRDTQNNAKSTSSTCLQDRLTLLLARLTEAFVVVRDWPEQEGESESRIHLETTATLLDSLDRVLGGVRSVEEKVNRDDDLVSKLRQVKLSACDLRILQVYCLPEMLLFVRFL